MVRNLQQQNILTIDSFLTNQPIKILDIGCGLGIFDVAVYDYYGRNNNIKFYMVDKTTSSAEEKKIYYGYRPVASFYNNLDYTKEFMNINGIPNENIVCISVDNDIEKTKNKVKNMISDVDLVISIISWGVSLSGINIFRYGL